MKRTSSPIRHAFALSLSLLLLGAVHRADALSLAIVESDTGGSGLALAGMQATGDFSSVTLVDAASSTPTLSTLSSYDAVLVYTNNFPSNGTALGNVLASYYDLGGKALTIATYGFSGSWAIGGTVMTGSYAGFVDNGSDADVSGNLVATVPTDPIFTGINLSQVSYYHNFNYAHPGLAAGATLLATDGNGVDMIARSTNGIIDMNIFPTQGASPTTYNLIANTLDGAGTQTNTVDPVPEPGTALFGLACTAAVAFRRHRRQKAAGI